MARPHHRKKHKEHLRHYQQSRTPVNSKAKGRATRVFALAGIVVGLFISYFASGGAIIWISVGLVAGGAIGYLIGMNLEREAEKK